MLLQSDKRRSSGHYHRSQLSVRLGRRVPRADFNVSLFCFCLLAQGSGDAVLCSCDGEDNVYFFFS